MGFFASWWERLPKQQIAALVTVVAVLGFVAVQGNLGRHSERLPWKAYAPLSLPTGEVWD